jgi:periplasmic protein CpxP/Spy
MNTKILRNGVLFAASVLAIYGSPVLARAASNAQDAGQTQAAPTPKRERKGPDLNLTDDQKAQMKKLRESAKSQIAAVNSDSSLSADQKQEKVKAIHRDTHKQMQAMLTPEQRQTMKAWRKAHRGEKGEQQPPAAS